MLSKEGPMEFGRGLPSFFSTFGLKAGNFSRMPCAGDIKDMKSIKTLDVRIFLSMCEYISVLESTLETEIHM